MKRQDTAPENARGKRVKAVELCGTADVYNMTVDGCHNYAIGSGLIVHNCEAMRYGLMSRPSPARQKKPTAKILQFDPLSDDRPRRVSGFMEL